MVMVGMSVVLTFSAIRVGGRDEDGGQLIKGSLYEANRHYFVYGVTARAVMRINEDIDAYEI